MPVAPGWRLAKTLATLALLTISAAPFVALFPQPPAFGRGAAAILATFAVLATVGTTARAGPVRQTRIMLRGAVLSATTVAAFAAMVLSAGHHMDNPTTDILPRLFGLQGEDIDDAVLYEVWVEIWLACALVAALAFLLRRLLAPKRPEAGAPGPSDLMIPPLPRPPWNAPTILLWLIGCALLCGAVVDGHVTAAFLSGSVHVTGTIADPQPHPRIRFTATDGSVVVFTQNGSVSRALGAEVPVAYQTHDPAGTARADTFWANWSIVLSLVWIGLGFTLAPFYGFRAVFKPGRW